MISWLKLVVGWYLQHSVGPGPPLCGSELTRPMCTPPVSAPPFQVLVENKGLGFAVLPGQTILAAAEAAGIDMPNSCRNGTCRTCLCRLNTGQVGYLIAWPGLSAEEKAAGVILPCVAVPLSDLRVHATAKRRDNF